MGAVEETGKAIGGFIDVMKHQPLSLALVAMNLALMGLIYVVAIKAGEARQQQMTMIFKAQSEIQQLLARCVVPDSK